MRPDIKARIDSLGGRLQALKAETGTLGRRQPGNRNRAKRHANNTRARSALRLYADLRQQYLAMLAEAAQDPEATDLERAEVRKALGDMLATGAA